MMILPTPAPLFKTTAPDKLIRLAKEIAALFVWIVPDRPTVPPPLWVNWPSIDDAPAVKLNAPVLTIEQGPPEVVVIGPLMVIEAPVSWMPVAVLVLRAP